MSHYTTCTLHQFFSADPNNDIINDNSGPGEQMFDLSFYPKPRGPRDIRSGIIDLSINEETYE